jgi:poly-beta-hydroxyalkanoate depolymerase
MDLAAEYYMQTIETVFVRHALPKADDSPWPTRGPKAIHNAGL